MIFYNINVIIYTSIYIYIKICTYIIINDAQGCFISESVETSNHHNQRPIIPTSQLGLQQYQGLLGLYHVIAHFLLLSHGDDGDDGVDGDDCDDGDDGVAVGVFLNNCCSLPIFHRCSMFHVEITIFRW